MKKIITFIAIGSLAASLLSGCNKPKESVTQGGSDLTTLKLFSNMQIKNEQEKAWIKYIEDEKKIKLEFESPPDSNYKERLQIMLVSGQYPDLVLFKSHNDIEFKNAVSGGVVVPVNKYLDKMENIKKYSYENDFDALRINNDENIYGIPRSTVQRSDGFIIRKDWLANVGLSVEADKPVTLAQFEEILRRFTYNDPDGNGKNDTYGICSYSTSDTGLQMAVTQPFLLYGWQSSDEGSYKYMDPRFSRINGEYKKALEYNSKLFKEGLINPDSPVLTTENSAYEKFKQGLVGVSIRFPGYLVGAEKDTKKVDPNAEIVYISGIENVNGEVKGGVLPLGAPGIGYWNFWSITSSNKHPEKTIELLDWMLSDGIWETTTMLGLEGHSYNIVDGKKIFTEQSSAINKSIVRRNDDPEFFIMALSDDVKEQARVNINTAMGSFIQSKDRGYEPKVTEETAFIDYKKNMAEELTKILIGEKPVAEYDNLLDGWYKNGGEEYVAEMNDWIVKMENK